jgi:predicted Zn-dependent peptidase
MACETKPVVNMEQLIITERTKALVHAIIGVKTGWRHEEVGKRGITHFLEHAVFLGNSNHPSPDIEAAEYGVQLHGMTLPEHTLFWFTSTKEDFAEVFKLFLSLIFHPDFDKDKIERERKDKITPAVVHESNYTPWELAYEWAKNLTFDWDFRLSLGKETDIASLTKENLEAWHERYYNLLNSFLVIHGNINESNVAKLVENANIPLSGESPFHFEIQWKEKEISIEREGMKNVELVYGFKLPQYDVRYEILSVILGNNPLSKLWGEKFSKFAYTVGSRMEWTSTGGGLFLYFGAISRDSARELDENLWFLLKNFEIDNKELQVAKKIRSLEISSGKEEGEHGLLNLVLRNPFQKFRNFKEMVEELNRVKRDQILALAERFLKRDNAVKVVIGQRK